jgi:hypothetical protein
MMSIDMFWSSLLISDLECEIKTISEAMMSWSWTMMLGLIAIMFELLC